MVGNIPYHPNFHTADSDIAILPARSLAMTIIPKSHEIEILLVHRTLFEESHHPHLNAAGGSQR